MTLPPLDNLLILGTPAWKPDQLKLSDAWSPWAPWEMKNADKWALGYLKNALQYMTGRMPWRGVAGSTSDVGEVMKGGFDSLSELVHILTEGRGPPLGQSVPMPSAIPYEWSFLSHPSGAGTRVIYSHADLPIVRTRIREWRVVHRSI